MQHWNISVFLLCQMLAMPLIVGGARGGAPPKSPSCRGFCLLIDGGGPAVWKQSVIGMGDNKNFMSRYIKRVIITIIDIITISLNSTTGTKIVKMSRKYFTDMNVSEQ